MPLPQSVQAQLDAANALLATANTPPQPAEPQPQEVAQPAAPAPVAQPAPPAATAPAPAPAPDVWEQRYKSLQGIHRSQTEQFQQLQQRLSALEAARTAAPTPPAEAPKPPVNPKDVEAFGLDMVEMVQRLVDQNLTQARQVIAQSFDALNAQIEALAAKIDGTSQHVAKTAEDLFFDSLTKQVPDWAAINEHEGFLRWIAEVDPLYNLPRQAALNDAQAKGDANRAAAVFRAFLSTVAKPAAPGPTESPTPRSTGGAPPAPSSAKPTYSSAEVQAFYNDVRRGAYRGNEPLRLQREAQYNAAMAEGRITQ